jgi:hypothetical protein
MKMGRRLLSPVEWKHDNSRQHLAGVFCACKEKAPIWRLELSDLLEPTK